jgi:prophage regulatory protein
MRIMRLKEVTEKTGLAKSTVYNLISQGKFPKQIDLGARSVGWVDTEIEEWLLAKIELRDSESSNL